MIQALTVEIATDREVVAVVAEEAMEIVVLREAGEVVSHRVEATEATVIMVMMAAAGDKKLLTTIITIISGEVAKAQPNTLVHVVVVEVECLPRVAATTLLQTPTTPRSSKSFIIKTSKIRASSAMCTEWGSQGLPQVIEVFIVLLLN